MAHPRQQIRDAAFTAVSNLTTTGDRAYNSRVYPYDALPCLTVFTVSEERNEEEGSFMGLVQLRDLQLMVEARAKSTSLMETTLDTICEEVESALHADTTLGGLIEWIEYTGVEIDLSEDSEQPTGVARITFLVQYRYEP